MNTCKDLHNFQGKWITDEEFYELQPRNVFHRQLDKVNIDYSEHRNRHILFRKKFKISDQIKSSSIFISADDYYKLYINGKFVAQGPASSYHFRYNYNVIDVSPFLNRGENVIAVHTLYQGLINRVWQSGDNRHGLILDLEVSCKNILSTDQTFKVSKHSGYREIGTFGLSTGFLEEYDSNAREVGFERQDYNDDNWSFAKINKYIGHVLHKQDTEMLEFEKILPAEIKYNENSVTVDFGSNYVGYLKIKASGKSGQNLVIRAGQELNEDGSVRYKLRANCVFEESWILCDGISELVQYDYKAFRYAELLLPNDCKIEEIYLIARHYPFKLSAKLKDEFAANKDLLNIWNLCVNTQKYGVQEAVLDCMEREKGFYLGDGCYTALAHMILTGDDSMVRKLIDDAFSANFITDGLITCLNCSFMQEIAEYPLMLVKLILWHYRLTADVEYLKNNYFKAIKVIEAYRRDYEKDFLLCNIDKWCVVEWPRNFQDGYDVDVKEGQICKEPHVALNAYYVEAVRVLNKIAAQISVKPYRDEKPLIDAFIRAFYDSEKHLFKDSVNSEHISMIGNILPFAYELCPDETCKENILKIIKERKISSVSLFGSFPLLEGLVRYGREDLIAPTVLDGGAWLRMIKEGATTVFEGWGKDTKKNISLFHLTLSYVVVFLADINLSQLLK